MCGGQFSVCCVLSENENDHSVRVQYSSDPLACLKRRRMVHWQPHVLPCLILSVHVAAAIDMLRWVTPLSVLGAEQNRTLLFFNLSISISCHSCYIVTRSDPWSEGMTRGLHADTDTDTICHCAVKRLSSDLCVSLSVWPLCLYACPSVVLLRPPPTHTLLSSSLFVSLSDPYLDFDLNITQHTHHTISNRNAHTHSGVTVCLLTAFSPSLPPTHDPHPVWSTPSLF
jgi:hypothetical protein